MGAFMTDDASNSRRSRPSLRNGLAVLIAIAAFATSVPAPAATAAPLQAPPGTQAPAGAQAPERAPATQDDLVPGLEPTEEIRRRLDTLKALEAPTAEDKARIDRLTLALEALSRAQSNREKAVELRDLVAQLPSRVERAAAPLAPPAMPEAGAALEQLEQALKVASAETAAARDAVSQGETQLTQLAERRRVLPDELAHARTQLTEETQAADALAPAAAGSPDTARQLALAQVTERKSEVSLLEAELASLDARGQLLAAQRDAAQRRLEAADAVAQKIRAELERTRGELAAAAEAAAKEPKGEQPGAADPRVTEAVAQNARVASALRDAGQQVTRIAEETRALSDELSRVERDFRVDQERSRVAGTTGGLSAVLRSQRRALPSLRRIATSTAAHRDERIAVDLARIDWGVELDALVARERALPDEPENAQLRTVLQERREKLLQPLIRTLDQASTDLSTLESLDVRLAETVTAYRDFIDERILWARSGPSLWEAAKPGLSQTASVLSKHLGDGQGWRALADPLRRHPFPALFGLIIAGALILTRPFVRRWLGRLAEAVSRGHSDRFVLTLEALVATLLLSMAVPIAMAGVGISMRWNEIMSPFAAAVGTTLLQGSLWMALLLFTFRLVRRQGLAADHFGWRRDHIEIIHRVARGLLLVATPFLLLSVFLARLAASGQYSVEAVAVDQSISEVEALRTASSLAAVPFFLVLIWAGWRLFRPSKGVLSTPKSQSAGGWMASLRFIWCAAVVAVPTAALVLTLLGWSYTASVLVTRLIISAELALAVVVLEAILLRAREFAARAFAHQSRERLLEAPTPIEGTDALQKQEVRSEVAALSRKTGTTIRGASKVLLFGGLILVWSDLLPALRVLDGVTLWSGAHGVVTLGHLMWALIIAVIVGFAARNLPGALEVLILQHTGMSPAGRYAAAAVVGYGIVIVGVLAIASQIGLSWQSVQWLVAAIGVGLGFGLQEIVGNFVAGLIVLFEQPVRVGDVVTVGDRTGQVVKIRIRATTVRDADGKDLIIPNKHLITERVVNWTLSGAPLRLVLPVGVAYETDLALAEQLMLGAAASVPAILQTPAPVAQLMGFGASSIDFEVRVFVDRIEELLPARHALAMAIQSAFTEAGITIAFPQLDIHVGTEAIERIIKEVQR